jgi:hypothetical protein
MIEIARPRLRTHRENDNSNERELPARGDSPSPALHRSRFPLQHLAMDPGVVENHMPRLSSHQAGT